MKKLGLFVVVLFTLFIFAGISHAAEKKAEVTKPAGSKTIVGKWTVVGMKGSLKGKELAVLEVYQKGDTYEAKYIKLLPAGIAAYGTKCTTCNGERKDQSFDGMLVVWGMKKTGDNKYTKGRIYSTEKGDDYGCKMSLKDPDMLILSGCIAFLCEDNFYPRVKQRKYIMKV